MTEEPKRAKPQLTAAFTIQQKSASQATPPQQQ